MSGASTPDRYDGTSSFPAPGLPGQTSAQRAIQLTVTGVIVVGPFVGLVAALWLLWGHGVGFADVGLAVFFYLLTGYGLRPEPGWACRAPAQRHIAAAGRCLP